MNVIAQLRSKANKISKIKYNIFINMLKNIEQYVENLNRKLESIRNNIMNTTEPNN